MWDKKYLENNDYSQLLRYLVESEGDALLQVNELDLFYGAYLWVLKYFDLTNDILGLRDKLVIEGQVKLAIESFDRIDQGSFDIELGGVDESLKHIVRDVVEVQKSQRIKSIQQVQYIPESILVDYYKDYKSLGWSVENGVVKVEGGGGEVGGEVESGEIPLGSLIQAAEFLA